MTLELPLVPAIAAIMAAVLLLRLVPRRLIKIDPTDAWSHLYVAKLIKRDGKIPRRFEQVVPPSEASYPWGIAWAMYRFRVSRPVNAGINFNTVISLLEIAATASIGWYVLSRSPAIERPATATIVAASTFVFLPYVLGHVSGFYSLTARPLGIFLCNVSMAGLVLGTLDDPRWFAMAALCIPLQVFTSKFSMQGLYLGAIVLSAWLVSPAPVLVVISVLVLTALLSGGRSWFIMKGHFYHSLFFYEHLQSHHVATVHRVLSLNVFLRRSLGSRSLKQTAKFAYWTPALRVLAFFPWFLCVVLVVGVAWDEVDEVGRAFMVLPLAAYLVIPPLTHPRLKFLGEGDRYVAFIGLNASALAVGYLVALVDFGPVVYAAMFTFCIMASVAILLARWQHRHRSSGEHEEEVIAFLRELEGPEQATVLTVPTNLLQRFMSSTNLRFAGLFLNAPFSSEGRDCLKRIYDQLYPFPSMDFARLASEFGVDYVLYSKRHCTLEYQRLHGLEEGMLIWPDVDPIFENDGFALFKIQLATVDSNAQAR